jgi:lipopolysaccharide/colanic/teichoic acid biosynthesis glycosyltransferase
MPSGAVIRGDAVRLKENQCTGKMSRWTESYSKRVFDLTFAVPLLIASLPLMAIIVVAIKLREEGPVLFRQFRTGRHGKLFQIIKFRTMACYNGDAGPSLTQGTDPRITAVGHVLRRWKLDELPQLFNVALGEMSLVGPRPDLPKYLDGNIEQQRQLLALRPGVTGVASLQFRAEEALLAEVSPDQLDRFYVEKLLPEKIRLELEYARDATWLKDLNILARTAFEIFEKRR